MSDANTPTNLASAHPAVADHAPKIHILGLGDDGLDGLSPTARQIIERADLIVGTPRLLELAATEKNRQLVVGSDLEAAAAQIAAAAGKRIVVLASGDPLFYGVARFFCDKLGKDRFEVVPHVSSMQLAFARVKESWEDAYLANLYKGPLERAFDAIRVAEKVGLFTSDELTPAKIARELLDRRITYFRAYVCENLGSRDERVTQGELADIAAQEFSPLNVMILVRKPNVPDKEADGQALRIFGNSDDVFLQSRPKYGLLTPAEVRCIALAQMNLRRNSIVWDIGAGSGSVAIEAAQLATAGKVYAIEMDVDDHQLILSNATRFGVTNLDAVLGRAPEAWENLPNPDSVFVGGSGRMVNRVVELAFERLQPGGRLVASVGSIENLAALNETLGARTSDAQVWMINVARGTYQLERVRFEAINPSFIVAATKPK
ncbi:MAG: precorrin-6y C5,15-methyltransferase (decarboxylating) subunit CbiE [Pirellulales bacterium]